MVRARCLLLAVRHRQRQRVRVEGSVERRRCLPTSRQPDTVRGRVTRDRCDRPRGSLPPGMCCHLASSVPFSVIV